MIGTPILYYVETKPHIFIFASLGSIFSRRVWNTIDDRYSSFVFYIETKPHSLIKLFIMAPLLFSILQQKPLFYG